MLTKAKFNIMGSKSNFSPAQVKEILDAHENTLMKFFNTGIERLERKVDNLTTENAVLKKEMADLTQSYRKPTMLMMKILKLWLMIIKTCM